MDGWKGVTKEEEDDPPLMAFVRVLSANTSERTTLDHGRWRERGMS